MTDAVHWPDTLVTEILPRLWMGGLDEHEYLGEPITDAHYAFNSPYAVVLTLYADAQPAPWGVVELRYGFPDDTLPENSITPCLPLAQYGWSAWRAGATVLIRCQQGVNRSGLVTALVLMLDGMTAPAAIDLIRQRRGTAVLNNTSFEEWLVLKAPNHLHPQPKETPHE